MLVAQRARTGATGTIPHLARARDASGCVGDASRGEEITMLQRPCLLSMVIPASCTSAALPDEHETRPNEVPGWGRVIDPWRDCDVSLDAENERLRIQVPGTPHVLGAEVSQLPMNAPLVVRRVRGDFTANVHVLGRLAPGR
jgi:hypothetical protein